MLVTEAGDGVTDLRQVFDDLVRFETILWGVVDGAGHYPHAQCPEAVAELVIPFLKEHAGD